MKKILTFPLALALGMTSFVMPVSADDEPETPLITSLTAYTRVGAGDREVYAFEMKVSDPQAIAELKAEDFDILNNGTCLIGTADNEIGKRYEDDGIVLSIEGDTLTMEVTPFRYAGIYEANFSVTPWEAVCTNEALSFKAADVTDLKTQTVDDAYIGEYTAAGLTRKYALYVPKDENGEPKTDLPLVIWNHGGGEYNVDIMQSLVANRGFTAWNEEGYECAVLMIQVANPNYSYRTAANETKKMLIDQNNALQAALVRDLIADGTVNADRVYVTGASSGGGATMRFLMQYPEMFAGAIAMCSMDPIVEVHQNRTDTHEQIVAKFEDAWKGNVYTWDEETSSMVAKSVNTRALLNVPIYYTHAADDTTCKVESSKAMFESMENLGDTNNELFVFSKEEMAESGIYNIAGGGLYHWSWVKVLSETEEGTAVYKMFQQVRPEPFVFDDVTNSSKYYYEPVYWAYNQVPQITTGTSPTTFSPDETVTRAQFVTFLYRAAGEPDVSADSLPFKDVKQDAYYYNAVAWAFENNITTGTSATKFAPNESVSRAQIVTFLYRFAGSPEVTAEIPFADVSESAYYAKPVAWAYENNITTGVSADRFAPTKSSTRGQAVTFLYRVFTE